MQNITYALLLCLAVAVHAGAQTLTSLASFDAASASPNWLIQGADGNFYGVTGATSETGAIFEATPAGALTTLYGLPYAGNSLIQASDGNFYGTTFGGGTGICGESYDRQPCGTIFQFTPAGSFTTLFNFDDTHGAEPIGGLVQGADGNFYGASKTGGANNPPAGSGTIFKMTPGGTVSLLHSFAVSDGEFPMGLMLATDGNLYGSTLGGGPSNCGGFFQSGEGPLNCGTLFKISTVGTLNTLYSFTGMSDGVYPSAGLTQGVDGNFYGTTAGVFGSEVGPTVFRLTPGGMLTTLHTFQNTDGVQLQNTLVQAADGNFYGIASSGGNTVYGGSNYVRSCNITGEPGCGTLFKLTPSGTFTVLYNFCGQPNCADGMTPSSLILGKDGNLYGTTSAGGSSGNGTFFEFSFSAPNTPAIASSGGVLNGASFQPGISPGSWMTINGTNLSSKTDTWNNAIVNGALPITLDGVSVTVGGQPAYIEYISSTQINAVVPNVPAGSVPVIVTNGNGTSQAVMAQLQAEQPAFFQWGNYAVATRQDFSLAVKNGTFPGTTTVPAKPGDVIILWGTGFGSTSPSAPAGVETPSTATYNTATAVNVTVGGKPATVYGAALAPGYAGLYQVAIQIPASLANGDYPVVALIASAQSPSTTLITVQQ